MKGLGLRGEGVAWIPAEMESVSSDRDMEPHRMRGRWALGEAGPRKGHLSAGPPAGPRTTGRCLYGQFPLCPDQEGLRSCYLGDRGEHSGHSRSPMC